MIADVRYPLESLHTSSTERWSQWRLSSIIELSARDTCHFVTSMIPGPGRKILEVGCGNGYLSLELARAGHDVTSVDLSPEIIEVAERTKAAHPLTAGGGTLTYQCADIRTWQATENRFDAVVINRALHHLPDLPSTLTIIKRLLGREGLLICQDYAYDRLDEPTAAWMYTMQRLLFLSGISADDPATVPDDEVRSLEEIRVAWLQRGTDHRLNGFDEMMQALRSTFHEQHFSWVPYLFVYIGNSLCHATAEQERACITFLKHMEQYLIEKESIQAVGFRYVGSVST
ncbi:MAG TPA: class I SAM-dependent methyltransferase [Ktedonobacteraceae bacterium]|nr:class I SAM-dependent methyltransferase [Ktedonobacteraceae bacterium]